MSVKTYDDRKIRAEKFLSHEWQTRQDGRNCANDVINLINQLTAIQQENATLKSENAVYKKALEKLIVSIKKEHRGDKPVPHSPALCWAVNQANGRSRNERK